jgi:CBS domain containing-hemolysin-like protein
LHGEGPKGTLNKDEVSIVKAVLDLRDKTAERIMTKIDDVFMLPSQDLSIKRLLKWLFKYMADNRLCRKGIVEYQSTINHDRM